MAAVAAQWFWPATATLVGLQLQLASSTPLALHHHIIGPSPNGNGPKFHHQPLASSSSDPFLIERVLKSIDQDEQDRKTKKPVTKSKNNVTRHKRRQVSSSSFHPAATFTPTARDVVVSTSSPSPQYDRTQFIASSSKLVERESSELDYELDGGNQQPPSAATTTTSNNNNINNLPGTRRYNRPRNKKPVYVSINQQTVNGLLSLLLLFVVSICGTVGTIFIISSLTVIETLQTRGNCYLVSLALSHLLVALLVVPTSAIQIMAGDGIDGRLLCHYQWLTLEFSLIVGQLSFLLMAADNYLGYKSSAKVTTISTTTNVSMATNQQHPTPQNHSKITLPAAAANPTQNNPPDELQLTINNQINEPLMMAHNNNNKQCLLPIINNDDNGRKWRFSDFRSVRNLIASCFCLLPKVNEQKLRLINQFVDPKWAAESRVERPGCFSYRNCCGRLKVLFWISSVWLVASICTFHMHELRYGPNFCPAPVQSATKQPASNISTPQAVPVTGNSHAQSMLLLMNHHDELRVMNSSLEKISPIAGRFGRSIDHSDFNQANYLISGSHPTDLVPSAQTYHHSSSVTNETESSNRLNNVDNSLSQPTTTLPISTKEEFRIKPLPSNARTYDGLGGPNDGQYQEYFRSSPSAHTSMHSIERRCKGGCFDKSLRGTRGSGGAKDGFINDLAVARFDLRGLKSPQIAGPDGAGGQGNIVAESFRRPPVKKVVDPRSSFNQPTPDDPIRSEQARREDYGAHDDDDDDNNNNTDSNEMGTGTQPTETFELIGADSKTRHDSYHRNRVEGRLMGTPLKLFQGSNGGAGGRKRRMVGEDGKEEVGDRSCLPCKGSDCKCSHQSDGSAADNSKVGDSSSSRSSYRWQQMVSPQFVGGGFVDKGQSAASGASGHHGGEIIPIGRPDRLWWIPYWLPSGPLADSDAAQRKQTNFTKASNQQQQQLQEHLTIVEIGNGNHDVEEENNHHPILGNRSRQVKQDGLSSLFSPQAPSLLLLLLSTPLNKRQLMIEGWTQQFGQGQQQNRQNLPSPPLEGDENFRSHSNWNGSSQFQLNALPVRAPPELDPATIELKDLMNNDNHNGNSDYNPVVAVGMQTVMMRSEREAVESSTQDGSWVVAPLPPLSAGERGRRRMTRAVAFSGNNRKNSTEILLSPNGDDDDELPEANTTRSIEMEQANQYGANQLMMMLMANNNPMAPNEHEDSKLASQLNRISYPRGGDHFWLILFCTIILPTLISAILFLKAWLKMKIFKTRPYKPMPVLNSAMSNLLVTSPSTPQHRQMYPPETSQAPSGSLVGAVGGEGQQPSCVSQPITATRNLSHHQQTDKISKLNEANFHDSPRFKKPTANANQMFEHQLLGNSTLDSIHNRRSVSQPSGGANAPTDNQALSGPLGDIGPDKATTHEPLPPPLPLELGNGRSSPTKAPSNHGLLMSKMIATPPSPATVTLPAMSPGLPAQRQQVNQVMSAPIGYSHYVQQQQQQQQHQQQHYHHHLQHQYNQSEPPGAATNPYGNPCGLLPAGATYQQQQHHQDHQLSGPAARYDVMNRLGGPPPFQFDETVQVMRETYSSPSSASFSRREFGAHDELFSISEPQQMQQQTILRPSPTPSQEAVKPMANSSSSHLRSGSPQQQQQQHPHYHHHQHHHSSHQSPASRRLSPIQQQHYEFQRRQNHAKSFHYGSSDMRPRHWTGNFESSRQLTSTGSQPAALPALSYELAGPAASKLAACGGIVVSADRIDVANGYESGFHIIQQPEQVAAAAAMTITEKLPIAATMLEQVGQVEAEAATEEEEHRHLLERHRSLPRSSRLYHSHDQNSRHHSVNGPTMGYVASGGVAGGMMVVDPAVSEPAEKAASSGGGGGRQMRRHRKQQQRASIGGQIYEIGGAQALECGQVMDGGGGGAQIEPMSKALANIIKSMDASPPFVAAIEQQQPPVTGQRNFQWDGDSRRRLTNGEEFEILQHPSFHHGGLVKANEDDEDEQDVDGNLKKYLAIDGASSSSSSHANGDGFAKTLVAKYNDPAKQIASNGNTIINNNKAILCTYNHMTDDQLLQSNIIVFIVNLTLWLPFILLSIVAQYRDTLTQELKDSVWWLATLNCCSCSYVYAITNKDFREAFNKLFYYCCCKSHVTFQRKTPIFRRQLDLDSKGNLRIHIIPGLNVYSNKLNPNGGSGGIGELGGGPTLGPSGGGNHHWAFGSHAGGSCGGSQTGGTIGGTHSHGSGATSNVAYGSGPSSTGFSRSSAAAAAGHGTSSQPRHHHMSVGGGFGGPLFASSKLYSSRHQPDGAGSGSSKAYGRYHSSSYADSRARRKSTVGEL